MTKPHIFRCTGNWHVEFHGMVSRGYRFREACVVARMCSRGQV